MSADDIKDREGTRFHLLRLLALISAAKSVFEIFEEIPGLKSVAIEQLTPPGDAGHLAENVMHFARVLRRAGLPVGPDKVVDALRALEIAGIQRRDDFYWTLAAVFIDRHAQMALFDQAFHIYWRDPRLLERVMQLLLPRARAGDRERAAGRIAAAFLPAMPKLEDSTPQRIEFEAVATFSSREALRRMDFDSMSAEELAAARAAVAQMRLHLRAAPTRRSRTDPRGSKVDLRASLRAAARQGGAQITLRRRCMRRRSPPVVALCDISGSMSRYTRMFLYFLHALANDTERVHAFTFGTRLTSVTHHLRQRDADVALAGAAHAVRDWGGGTRIGACLHEFNAKWSRRLLAQGAVVLLMSDGLDLDAGAGLESEMERLHKSCRKLIWLNPLLRYPQFEAKPAGVKVMLPHVDAFLPVHNLQSLTELAAVLGRGAHAGSAQAAGRPPNIRRT